MINNHCEASRFDWFRIKACDEVGLMVFGDAGHLVQYDKADEVSAHIHRFVGG